MSTTPQCYFPNGLLSSRDIPCHSPSLNGGASACCAYSDICLDNQLCLGQTGGEVISRGTCTDQTWQSSECPNSCSDVNKGEGININLFDRPYHPLFCCGPVDYSNGTCMTATKDSTAPFWIPAGQVIFNRTSGSTSPNSTETTAVTATPKISSAASPSPSNCPSIQNLASSSSSKKDVAVGAAMSALLGAAFLITLGFLWRQRRQKQSLRKDVQTWEEKYMGLLNAKTGVPGGTTYPSSAVTPPYQLGGWSPDSNHNGEPHHLLDGWNPGSPNARSQVSSRQTDGGRASEVAGAPVYEIGNKP